jgi:hypothetical protein
MIITVITVYMMQVSIYQVIEVISMGNTFVSAVFPMDMSGVSAGSDRVAARGIFAADFQHVLIIVAMVGMV